MAATVSNNNDPDFIDPDQNANGIKEEDQDPDPDHYKSGMKEENLDVVLIDPKIKEEDQDQDQDQDQDYIYQDHCKSEVKEEESPDSDFFDQDQWRTGLKRHQDPESHDPAGSTNKQVKKYEFRVRGSSGEPGFTSNLDKYIYLYFLIY